MTYDQAREHMRKHIAKERHVCRTNNTQYSIILEDGYAVGIRREKYNWSPVPVLWFRSGQEAQVINALYSMRDRERDRG